MFSWLKGSGGSAPPPPPPSGGDGGDDRDKDQDIQQSLASGVGGDSPMSEFGTSKLFDPTVLERIVKAADALKTTEKADEIVGLVTEQEKSWQQKYMADQKEADVKLQQLAMQRVQLTEQERRETLEKEAEYKMKVSQYEDQLSRKRYEEQLQQQARVNEYERAKQEESVQRQEQERRNTMQHKEALRRQTEMLKVKADAEARTLQERENKDIRQEQLLLQAEEYRKTVIEGIKTAGVTIGDGLKSYLSDTNRMLATVGVVSGLALGIYAAKGAASVTASTIARRLQVPPLVRDTSRTSVFLNPIKTIRSWFASSRSDPLDGMVLGEQVASQLGVISRATANARRHGSHFRHLMLHGPPGTGKTMFARRLAKQTGMHYAIMAGGDVGPLGNNAVTELNKVFDWAESSSKGVVLFVDEADAFLRKRGVEGDGKMTETTRNALSTFLYRTGDPSSKFMLVFSTNEPTGFDRAVTDRVDEIVEMPLPSTKERADLLKLYFNTYVVDTTTMPIQIDDDVMAVDWETIASRLEGFSGRQIAKLCAAWQATANVSQANRLTMNMFNSVLENHLKQLKLKDQWAAIPSAFVGAESK
eukprot:m.29987 g.29987  ORF g.29987 m.29987 type:complete len:589 (-) comp9224_c1_seq1:33-1799(-)